MSLFGWAKDVSGAVARPIRVEQWQEQRHGHLARKVIEYGGQPCNGCMGVNLLFMSSAEYPAELTGRGSSVSRTLAHWSLA